MYLIRERNVNQAYVQGLALLHDTTKRHTRQSRAGDVLVANEPVTTHYVKPTERVLFNAQRNANPFFHLFEALWMLTGAQDVALPAYFVPHMADFSDDGTTFHAAYGHRWREHFGPHSEDAYAPPLDQLPLIIKELRDNPDSRRVVLQMWDPAVDLGRTEGRDLPCNVAAKLEIGYADRNTRDALNMTVFNRSNDIILGCYGANVVQFSFLQEYLAAMIGVQVGWYEQVSTNFHAYVDAIVQVWPLSYDGLHTGYEPIPSSLSVTVCPLVQDPDTFDRECTEIVYAARDERHIIGPSRTEDMHNSFFHKIATPMMWAYAYYRQQDVDKQTAIQNAVSELEMAITANGRIDWLVAGHEWMTRRLK